MGLEDSDKIKMLVEAIVNSENWVVPIPAHFNNSRLDVALFIAKYREVFSFYGISVAGPICHYMGKVIFFAKI